VRNRAAEKAKLSGYGTPSPLPQDAGTALGRHPAYSINGILGIHQPDANANLHKRKRDEEGDLPKNCLLVALCGMVWGSGKMLLLDYTTNNKKRLSAIFNWASMFYVFGESLTQNVH
jgi:hypothetical protein